MKIKNETKQHKTKQKRYMVKVLNLQVSVQEEIKEKIKKNLKERKKDQKIMNQYIMKQKQIVIMILMKKKMVKKNLEE